MWTTSRERTWSSRSSTPASRSASIPARRTRSASTTRACAGVSAPIARTSSPFEQQVVPHAKTRRGKETRREEYGLTQSRESRKEYQERNARAISLHFLVPLCLCVRHSCLPLQQAV